jgi:EmrB/QacA subfamily drug resistance transporter
MNGIAQAIRDAIDVQAELPEPGAASGSKVLAASTVGSSLVFLSGSVISVALPAIRDGLHFSATDIQWTLNAELLPLAAASMAGGALGDRYGRRNVFLAGCILFLFASLLAGFADGLASMLFARFLQGLAEALILPNGLTIVGQAYSLDRKSRAIGIWSGSIAVISAIGPAIAGILLDHFDWRVAFFINVPLAALGIVMTWLWVPRDSTRKSGSIDIGAAILSTVALGGLGWSLTEASGRAGLSPTVIGGLAVCIVALILLVRLERRRGDDAMLPPTLFGSRTLIGINIYTALLYGAFAILLTMIPYTMIRGSGMPASVAGTAFIPLQVLMAAISPLAPVVCARIGHRAPLAIGAVITAAGCALMLRITPGMGYWPGYFPPILIMSVGMSFAVAPLTTLVLTSVEDKYAGTASGFNGAISRAGSLVGIAVLGGLLSGVGEVSVAHMHTAMLCCAIACLASAAVIQLLVPDPFAA